MFSTCWLLWSCVPNLFWTFWTNHCHVTEWNQLLISIKFGHLRMGDPCFTSSMGHVWNILERPSIKRSRMHRTSRDLQHNNQLAVFGRSPPQAVAGQMPSRGQWSNDKPATMLKLSHEIFHETFTLTYWKQICIAYQKTYFNPLIDPLDLIRI